MVTDVQPSRLRQAVDAVASEQDVDLGRHRHARTRSETAHPLRRPKVADLVVLDLVPAAALQARRERHDAVRRRPGTAGTGTQRRVGRTTVTGLGGGRRVRQGRGVGVRRGGP